MLKLIFDYPSLFCDIPKIMRPRDDGLGDKLKFKTISLVSYTLQFKFRSPPHTKNNFLFHQIWCQIDKRITTSCCSRKMRGSSHSQLNESKADINYGIAFKSETHTDHLQSCLSILANYIIGQRKERRLRSWIWFSSRNKEILHANITKRGRLLLIFISG